MDEAAKALNLKPHLCGSSKFKLVRLASAADIEGHQYVFFLLLLLIWLSILFGIFD